MELSWLISAITLSIFVTSFGEAPKTDYCHLPYCGVNNLPCNNQALYSKDCAPNSRTISMPQYRHIILKRINEFRNLTASGGLKLLKGAARMSRMSYSLELEEMARLIAITCSAEKFCVGTPEFYYVGSILEGYIYKGDLNQYEDLELMTRKIEEWIKYSASINMKMGLYMPAKLENRNTAKAALLIAARNTHMGCAAMRFTIDHLHHFILVCAFSTDLFVRKPLYRMSFIPASACKEQDRTYAALCAVGEDYGNEKYKPGAVIFEPPSNLSNIPTTIIPA
ncbi:uncharacterized protein Dana_GF16488 [Drosophila ananassae]|uniref:SCP domain-containing protein n=1 Tax=Drosophila ananassae TaxID=7217 RepID=B3M2Y3_DROAN|nr:allergen Tab y 5.0101 [Drosophila ananassae]EDV43513.1 uncharacterized protein Dana_GF16488 [Drosophila ananassae]